MPSQAGNVCLLPGSLGLYRAKFVQSTTDVPADARIVPEKALRSDKKALAQELQGLGKRDGRILPDAFLLWRCICIEKPL